MLHVFEFDLQGSTKRFTIIVKGVCNSSGYEYLPIHPTQGHVFEFPSPNIACIRKSTSHWIIMINQVIDKIVFRNMN